MAQSQEDALQDSLFLIIEGNLKRIFATKTGYTTFREIQNVIFNCTNGNEDLANFFFELLINGKLMKTDLTDHQKRNAQSLISDFMIPIRVAKDIHERGEFMNFITSDMLVQQERCVFMNRLARVDGTEFLIMGDIQNTCHLTRHFLSRLLEAQKNPTGEKNLIEIKDDLLSLKNYLDLLLTNLNISEE
ncbi:MAG: DUF5414 family protein [Victivallaceae bacterium]